MAPPPTSTSAPESIETNLVLEERPPIREQLTQAQQELSEATFRYAGALACRHTNIFINSGRELRKGLKEGEDVTKNPQLHFETALERVVRLEQSQYADEEGKARAAVRVRYGEAGVEEGALIRLNGAVFMQRLEKGGFHEQIGQCAFRKRSNNSVIQNWRNLRRYAYERWYNWSEDGWRGRAFQVGSVAVLGMAAGAATASLAGVGLASAGGAAFFWRAARSAGVVHLDREAYKLGAEADHVHIHNQLLERRREGFANTAKGIPTLGDGGVKLILNEQFTNPANRQNRRVRTQLAIGAISVGAAALAGDIFAKYWSIIHQPAEHLTTGAQPQHHATSVNPRVAPKAPHHSALPVKPDPVLNSPKTHLVHAKQLFVAPRRVGSAFVSTVYEKAEGLHRGFADMQHAIHAAIAHGYLVQHTNPLNSNDFWEQVTAKGAKKFVKGAVGSSKTIDVMKVLSRYGHLTTLQN